MAARMHRGPSCTNRIFVCRIFQREPPVSVCSGSSLEVNSPNNRYSLQRPQIVSSWNMRCTYALPRKRPEGECALTCCGFMRGCLRIVRRAA